MSKKERIEELLKELLKLKEEISSLKGLVLSLKEERDWLIREITTTPNGDGDTQYLT